MKNGYLLNVVLKKKSWTHVTSVHQQQRVSIAYSGILEHEHLAPVKAWRQKMLSQRFLYVCADRGTKETKEDISGDE